MLLLLLGWWGIPSKFWWRGKGLDDRGHLVWTHFANKFYATSLTTGFLFFYDLVCSITTHTFFQPICEWAIRSKRKKDLIAIHKCLSTHIQSSDYMILLTQHRVHKPENLHQQYMCSQMKEIPYYVGYGYTNGTGPSLVHVELSHWLHEISLVSRNFYS